MLECVLDDKSFAWGNRQCPPHRPALSRKCLGDELRFCSVLASVAEEDVSHRDVGVSRLVTWQTDFQQAELTCSQAVTIASTTSSVDSVPEHYDRSVRVDVQPRTRSRSADDERHRSTWGWRWPRRGILRDHKIDLGSAPRFHADAADAQTATRNPIACHVDCESRQCRHFRILPP